MCLPSPRDWAIRRCTDIIATDGCPLRATTNCRLQHNRVRVAQHIPVGSIKTDWVASHKRDNGTGTGILDLPREIRDAIYDLLLPTGKGVYLDHLSLDATSKTSHWHPRPKRSRVLQPSWTTQILRVSQQIHHEAAARLYASNDFIVHGILRADSAFTYDKLLATFSFAGLIPLHPAYARFIQRIDFSFSQDSQRLASGSHHIVNPHAIRPTAVATVPIAPVAQHTNPLPLQDSTIAGPVQIQHLISSTHSAIAKITGCACIHLIPLDDNGTYTLRRPPGVEREKCKSRTRIREAPGRFARHVGEHVVKPVYNVVMMGGVVVLAGLLFPIAVPLVLIQWSRGHGPCGNMRHSRNRRNRCTRRR